MKVQARVTRQNQITVPAVVRRRLGVEGGGVITFDVTDEAIRIDGPELSLDEIIGSIDLPRPLSDDLDVEIEEAMEIETRRFFDPARIGCP